MTLIQIAQRPAPKPARWLRPAPEPNANCTPLQYRIVTRALVDDGELESDGPNRSPYLDELCAWAQIPFGSHGCALWVGKVYADAGALVPKEWPNCDVWLPYLTPIDDAPPQVRVGAVVVYGVRGRGPVRDDWRAMKADGWDAKHVGIIARWPRPTVQQLLPLTIECNRGYANDKTNNGVAIDLAPLTRTDVLGIVLPRPAGAD